MNQIPWLLFGLSALVSLTLSYAIAAFLTTRVPKQLRHGVRLMPPRLGGTVVFLSLSFTAAILLALFGLHFHGAVQKLFALVIASILIFLLGNLDDHRKLHYSVKIVCEIMILSLLPLSGFSLDFMTNLGGSRLMLPDWLGAAAVVAWLLFVMNAVNLIDGLDGLASGIVAIAAFTIFMLCFADNYLIAAASLALSASLVGILPFNRYPARLYLGDSGSLLIGFLIGFFSLFFHVKTYFTIVILIPIMILFVPVFNTGWVIVDRLQKKRNPFKGDIFHLHYRLLRQGLSHQKTVLFLWIVTGTLCALVVIRHFFPFRPRTVNFLLSAVVFYMMLFQVFLSYLKERRSRFVKRKSR